MRYTIYARETYCSTLHRITVGFISLFTVTLFICFSGLSLANDTLIVRQLDVEDGLSQGTVYDIFEDSYGFIWLATESGINRYDGYNFHPFSQSIEAPINITDSYISSINEDNSRQIWIGTNDGIVIYSSVQDKFEYIHPKSTPNTGLNSDNITAILRHSDGSMWVGAYDGLYHYDYQSKTFSHHPVQAIQLNEVNHITALVEAPNGTLIVGTQSQGVFRYNPRIDQYEHIFYSPHPDNEFFNQIHSLFYDSRQQLWIGSNAGLSRYNEINGVIDDQQNILLQFNISRERRQRVKGIAEDSKGVLWVSIYGKGIVSIDPRDLEHHFYPYVPTLKHGIPGDALSSLLIDSNGLLWIGTEGYGASIWNPISSAFSHLNHDKNKTNSLSSNVIWAIEIDKQNNLWLGTENGLNQVSTSDNKITQYNLSTMTTNPLTSDLIYQVQHDAKTGYFWLATDKGLNRFDPQTGQVQQYQHQSDDPSSISSNLVYDLSLDNRRQLWLATDGGLNRMDLTTGKIYRYEFKPDDPHSIGKNTAVTKLYIDTRGDLWVGTDNGVNRYNSSKDSFDRFLYDPTSGYHAETSFISSIVEIKRGILWIGHSGQGISTLDFSRDPSIKKRSPKVGHIGIKQGLPTNIVFGIIPDHFGRAWISTMAGLVLYEINGQNHQIFSVKDGLIANEFNDGAYAVGKDGTMYFGTINGLAIVNPGAMVTPESNHKLTFTHAVLYRNNNSSISSLLDKQMIELNDSSLAIKLQFSDFDFYWGHHTQYAYQFDDQNHWIDVTGSSSVTLNNLDIGHHQLKVRSKGRNGVWNEPKAITIRVNPPAWRTLQAYIAYLLILVLIGSVMWHHRKQQLREKQKLNAQLNLFAEAFKNTTEGVMIMHHARTIVAVNQAFTTITGYSETEAIDSGTAILSSNKHGQDFYEHIWQTLDEEQQWHGEIWQCNKQGVDIALEITISSVTYEDEQASHYVAVFSDITERLKAEQELRKLAKFDALTGLPNRTLLQDRLEHAILHSHREQQKLAVMFLDLDRFKQVNDSLGHDIGDLLLIAVAERISNLLREDDTFARLGGDEFVIILEDTADLNGLIHIANLVIKALATPFDLVEYEVSTSTSIGIAMYPVDGETSQALMKNADTAMYHAKAEGRNNFQFYTQSMNIQAFERLSIENELRQGLENEEFVLHFQPRVNSDDGSVSSLEALIRWEHPKKGFLPPSYFIDIAEESGLIVSMSEWVINKACHQLSSWTNAGFNNVSLSVNLSPRLFSHYDLTHFIEQTLRNYQLSPSRLELEITESMLMQDVESTIEELHRLSDLGCHISVDDFGTGYSSLSYIHRFPVHTLKIDRSFVSAINEHDKGKALVDIIINLAHNLDLDLVAEGVETQEQFDFLRHKAKQQIQGFYFSKAVDSQAAITMLINGFDVDKNLENKEIKEI